jgi:hypothetical protein
MQFVRHPDKKSEDRTCSVFARKQEMNFVGWGYFKQRQNGYFPNEEQWDEQLWINGA